MSEGLKGYDGSVDGVKLLRGLAIVAHRAPAEARQTSINDTEGEFNPELVIQRAVEVIGSREEAMRWLGTPVRALDYATPISCLRDAAGREQVLSVLEQLESGVL
jgi:uncharacterized protein (DUF2384 family)